MTNVASSTKTNNNNTPTKKVQRPSVSTVSSNHDNSMNSSTIDVSETYKSAKCDSLTFTSTRSIPYVKQPVQVTKFKTEMCKNLEINGGCRYGDNCFFAHNKEELQSRAPYNHYYKTKICKHYNSTGFCPYASRCQYFHVKSNQLYNELLDSFEKKIALRMGEEDNRLNIILENTDRVQKRLAVFKKLAEGDDSLSFQEKCLEKNF